jgi:hypothetical protein
MLSDPDPTVRGMPTEIMKNLAAAADAAAEKVTGAEADAALARTLLDDLEAASSTAVRTLPPDPSVKVLRHYVGADGRKMVELEIDLPDDLVAFLGTLPDANAFIEEALRRAANKSTLGRHSYQRKLCTAAQPFGLSIGWSSDLDLWMDHFPEPPRRLTPEILASHARWLSQRQSVRESDQLPAQATDVNPPMHDDGSDHPGDAGGPTA